MIILFGGGDGGGFSIFDGQVHPIPPLGPDLVEYLRALGHLVRVGEGQVKAEVATDAQQAARNLVGRLSQFEKAAGVIITEGRVADFAFSDVDGGFICGNNGRNLVSFPPRPRPIGGAAALR